MKHPREEAPEVSLALSLSTDSSSTSTVSSGSPPAPAPAKRRRKGPVVATSGEGDFVCKTCGRAFTSFQALGGHRTSHLRGAHGLDLGVVGAKALKQHKHNQAADSAANDDKQQPTAAKQQQQHECHICGLGFEMGQALGGHMRRHREEMAADDWVWRTQEVMPARHDGPPILLQLFA